MQGITVVKKVTEAVLKDYGAGIFSDNYESAAKAPNSESNSMSGTHLNASEILKPIEDFAVSSK